MNTNIVSSSGVQVLTHFPPTFGSTTVSRRNRTITSSTLRPPDGTTVPRRTDRRTMVVTMKNTAAATTHSMNTCLLIEKSMPKMGSKCHSGCGPFDTWPMMSTVFFDASGVACPPWAACA